MPSADNDVAQAFAAKWDADSGLTALVPGGLQQGRLSSYQPGTDPRVERSKPYASFDVTKSREGTHQTPGPGGIWTRIDYRLVKLEIRGLKPDVEKVLAYIADNRVFNRRALQTQAPFMACLQLDDDDLAEDEATKKGEDIWVGTVKLEVWTQRNE